MAVKKLRPITASKRHMIVDSYDDITASKPEKSLLQVKKRSGGRNGAGLQDARGDRRGLEEHRRGLLRSGRAALAVVGHANQRAHHALQRINELQDEIQLLEHHLAGNDEVMRERAIERLKEMHQKIDEHFGSVPFFEE